MEVRDVDREQLAKLESEAETRLEYYEQTGSMSVLRTYEECIKQINRINTKSDNPRQHKY